jgi:hypothetical protein
VTYPGTCPTSARSIPYSGYISRFLLFFSPPRGGLPLPAVSLKFSSLARARARAQARTDGRTKVGGSETGCGFRRIPERCYRIADFVSRLHARVIAKGELLPRKYPFTLSGVAIIADPNYTRRGRDRSRRPNATRLRSPPTRFDLSPRLIREEGAGIAIAQPGRRSSSSAIAAAITPRAASTYGSVIAG